MTQSSLRTGVRNHHLLSRLYTLSTPSYRSFPQSIPITWSYFARFASSAPDKHLHDIIPDDLEATLEAHRASNRNHKLKISRVFSRRRDAALPPPKFENYKQVKSLPKDHVPSTEHMYNIRNTRVSEERGEQHISTNKDRLDEYKRIKSAATDPSDGELREAHESFRIVKYVNPLPYRPMQPSAFTRKPWDNVPYKPTEDPYELFDRQIDAVTDFITLSEADQRIKIALAEDLLARLRSNSEGVEFELRGSIAAGVASIDSDIDVGMWMPLLHKGPGDRGPSLSSKHPAFRKTNYLALQEIQKFLESTKLFAGFYINNARYQLLGFRHIASNSRIQIVIDLPDTHRTNLVRNAIQEHPGLKPVYLIMKEALRARRHLHGTVTGGIGSYPLFMMVLASMEMFSNHGKAGSTQALLDFVRFYAKFDTSKEGISLSPAYTFPKRHSRLIGSAERKEELRRDSDLWWRNQLSMAKPSQPFLLCLIDPADLTNDLGRRTYRYRDIQATFRGLKTALEKWFEDRDPQSAHVFGEFFMNSLDRLHKERLKWRRWVLEVRKRKDMREDENVLSVVYPTYKVRTVSRETEEEPPVQSAHSTQGATAIRLESEASPLGGVEKASTANTSGGDDRKPTHDNRSQK